MNPGSDIRSDGDGGAGRPRRRWLLLGLLVLLVGLAGCGEPQPVPTVCHGCEEAGAVRALPENATAGGSTTHLHLDGEARVVARTRLDAGTAAELRRNASRRRAVLRAVRDARAGTGPSGGAPPGGYGGATPHYESSEDGLPLYPVPAFEARNLSVRVDERDRLVVGFRVAGVPDEGDDPAPPLARSGYGGSVLVDRFHTVDGRNPHPGSDGGAYRLATDRLVVHAPPGTRPVVAPPAATVRGDRVALDSLPADGYLVFAPPGAVGTVSARATLTADVLGWVVPDAAWAALVPLLQLGVVLAGLRRAETEGAARYTVGAMLVPLLLVLAPAALLFGPVGAGAVLLILGAGAGLAFRRTGGDGLDLPTDDDRSSVERVRPWLRPAGTVVVALAALTTVAAAFPGSPLSGLLFWSGGLLSLGALAALGWVGETGTGGRRWLAACVLAGPWLFAAGLVVGRDRPEFLGALLLILTWGTLVTVAGVVCHRLAARVARSWHGDPA